MVPESTAVKSPAAADVLHKARILLADDQPDVLQALRDARYLDLTSASDATLEDGR